MKRRSSIEIFQSTFPSVNIQTRIGMGMFQGFVAGYNKALDSSKAAKTVHSKQIEALKSQIRELEDYILCFRLEDKS